MSKGVCCVGSCSVDLFVRGQRLPNVGETVIGSSFFKAFGGKGANQSVQCALLGSSVTFIGKIGADDSDGIKANFVSYGVDVSFLQHCKTQSCGVALIEVEEKTGKNRIVVVPGANGEVTLEQLASAKVHISKCSYIMLQLEIPLLVTVEALQFAKNSGVKTIFNPSPVPENADNMKLVKDSLKFVDFFIVNEHEAKLFGGLEVVDVDSAIECGKKLFKDYAMGHVIITLGEKGAVLGILGKEQWSHISAPAVDVVDTTGAGDSFLGAFCHFLNDGFSLEQAIDLACKVAALACEKQGCMPSYVNMGQFKLRFNFNK